MWKCIVGKRRGLLLVAGILVLCIVPTIYELRYVHTKHWWVTLIVESRRSDLKGRPMAPDNSTVVLLHWTERGGASVNDELHTCGDGLSVRITADRSLLEAADAVVFASADVYFVDLPVRYAEQKWILDNSESPPLLRCTYDAPGCVHAWLTDESLSGLFDWERSYRTRSELWKPFVPLDGRLVEWYRRKYVPPAQRQGGRDIGPVLWVWDTCTDANGQIAYAQELARHIRVDIYGKCNPNADMGAFRSTSDLYKAYKFAVAFEGATCGDYVTKSFFDAVREGALPVVLGGIDYSPFLPTNHSVVNAADFLSPKALALYLKTLDSNDTAYEEYFSYKFHPEEIRQSFVDTWTRQNELDLASDGWCVAGRKILMARRLVGQSSTEGGVPAYASCDWRVWRPDDRPYQLLVDVFIVLVTALLVSVLLLVRRTQEKRNQAQAARAEHDSMDTEQHSNELRAPAQEMVEDTGAGLEVTLSDRMDVDSTCKPRSPFASPLNGSPVGSDSET